MIGVPLAWSWRLSEATAAQHANWELIGNGHGVHWPDVDEDISAEGMFLVEFVFCQQSCSRSWDKSSVSPTCPSLYTARTTSQSRSCSRSSSAAVLGGRPCGRCFRGRRPSDTPVRAQGINLTLRDAIVAAKYLVPALESMEADAFDRASGRIQQERPCVTVSSPCGSRHEWRGQPSLTGRRGRAHAAPLRRARGPFVRSGHVSWRQACRPYRSNRRGPTGVCSRRQLARS